MPSVPRGYNPGQFDYIVRGLLVHLDDQNVEVRPFKTFSLFAIRFKKTILSRRRFFFKKVDSMCLFDSRIRDWEINC